jgi:transposase
MNKYIAIDVSKQTLDVCFYKDGKWHHFKTVNQKQGFKKIASLGSEEDWFVMEASGPYYLKLAMYLYENNLKVSVVNPLVIKRYSQMLLQRAKTDKKDAHTIGSYAMSNTLKRWHPEEPAIQEMRQIITAMQLLETQIRQNKNQQEAFKSSGTLSASLSKTLKSVERSLKKQRCILESELESIANQNYEETLKRVRTIKGIGKKTSIMLIVVTNNFKKFENYKQLIAYVGFSPRIYQSGTSIKGKGHICKMGKSQIRKMLYMCSWTAKQHNKGCRQMYERLKSNGKPEKVIKVALANKLLKQVFAIVINETYYDEDHKSQLKRA